MKHGPCPLQSDVWTGKGCGHSCDIFSVPCREDGQQTQEAGSPGGSLGGEPGAAGRDGTVNGYGKQGYREQNFSSRDEHLELEFTAP